MTPAAPSAAFLDWWFTPWRGGGPALFDGCQGELARRDAYRDWCRQAGLAPDLPREADWRWQTAAALDAEVLRVAAGLFAGLLAARAQDHQYLGRLAPHARRWCLALASTQPLARWLPDTAPALAEVALRVDQAVPGLWPRLALALAPSERPGVASGVTRRLGERDLRCWTLCVQQARASIFHDSRQE